MFNVFYQSGILLGPLIGLLLTGIAFQLTRLVAAVVFAALTVLQIRSLPVAPPMLIGAGCALGAGTLSRSGRLTPPTTAATTQGRADTVKA